MFIAQNESLMRLGRAADADRERIDRLWPLGPQVLEARVGIDTLREEGAQSVLTPRGEPNGFAAKAEQSAGQLVNLKQQFELRVGEAFSKAQEECSNLRSAIMAPGPQEHASTSQLQMNLEMAALRSSTETMNARLTVVGAGRYPCRQSPLKSAN